MIPRERLKVVGNGQLVPDLDPLSRSNGPAPPRVLLGVTLYGYTPVRAQIGQWLWSMHEVTLGSLAGVHLTEELYVPLARNKICTEAIEGDYTHVLFLDADVVPPVGIIRRLVLRRKPIVSGLYMQKFAPHAPVAGHFARKDDDPYDGWRPLESVPSDLSRVEVVGGGCLLITTQALRQIQERFGPAWFDAPVGRGEDIQFSMKAHECGIGVYVDPVPGIQHVGTVNITSDYLGVGAPGDLYATKVL